MVSHRCWKKANIKKTIESTERGERDTFYWWICKMQNHRTITWSERWEYRKTSLHWGINVAICIMSFLLFTSLTTNSIILSNCNRFFFNRLFEKGICNTERISNEESSPKTIKSVFVVKSIQLQIDFTIKNLHYFISNGSIGYYSPKGLWWQRYCFVWITFLAKTKILHVVNWVFDSFYCFSTMFNRKKPKNENYSKQIGLNVRLLPFVIKKYELYNLKMKKNISDVDSMPISIWSRFPRVINFW